MTRIALSVNGKPVAADVAPRTHLADFLREHLLLTGTHIGCEHGICGACTVEIGGEIARSCITYTVACDGANVRTIEGFDDDPPMARLRRAFSEAHALQCGYCTPGMLIAARDLVRRKGRLSRSEIRREMSGNLCRCTGYQGIVDAIERVMADPAMPAQPAPAFEPEAHATPWLGPAPGPVASASAPATMTTDRSASEAAPARASFAPPSPSRAAPIRLTVGQAEEVAGATRIAQSFVLPHPREAVWGLMRNVEAAARCMPGLTLDGPPQGDKVSGRLEAKLGPIAASFAGAGTIRQIPGDYRQVVEGRGGDRKSGSHASGSVDYRLSALAGEAGGEATRVDVTITYALTGALAQFGRGGLVRDLVRRIGEAFAQNLDAQLRDPAAAMPRVRLRGFSLLLQVIADRIRAAILGRRD
jgi:carbon-monoxide dehydrogenase small subunit